MSKKKLIAGVATVAVLAGGSAAVAATTTERKAEEQAFLADAAKRLGVSSEQLTSALTAAQDARLAAAVKAGTLTQEQADAIKARRAADGTLLGIGRGGPGGHRGGGGPALFADAAKALGITEDALETQLRDGKTLAQIAQAEGKTLADVTAAVKQAAVARLDADLKAKRITQAQHDEAVDRLDEHIERLGDGKFRGDRGAGPRSDVTPTPTP
ncbi:hypothetical protein DVA67_007930 [Solirubrobacter sp. CPCC 204708]|uniref:Uncharacterized protein n=1 Tax=Solirubrobacter deserti TaxID=2282478 RepID=A0ABT4RSL1_9ACTN|nr:hypothetical protein [Solirubrobacter deserti]MBE2315900.1 hypothetical protein [Solirubrobacter deserti]MDA0141581.1 hypothetical protein [Solirubrobacter deserti]